MTTWYGLRHGRTLVCHLLSVTLASALLAGCTPQPLSWLATTDDVRAAPPRLPQRCAPLDYRFTPSPRALLGRHPRELRRWTNHHLPHHLPARLAGRLALLPNSVPGVALQYRVSRQQLVFVVVRSHGYSPALAPALSRQGLEGVVAALTGCRHYELCQARANLDEVLFQGRTTCRDTTLPLRLWTSRMTHQVIGIAAWLPDFAAPPANTKAQRKR